ncbi:hypothetical protein Droror1_Dr00011738 [Drosera rotundifolia]
MEEPRLQTPLTKGTKVEASPALTCFCAMANRNDNRGFRGHEGNRFNQNSMTDWPAGFSIQDALAQPLRREEVFQQLRDQGRPMSMPYGLQGSTTTFSAAKESQHYFQPSQQSDLLSQSTDPTPTMERAAHAYFRDQNNSRSFKLKHFWEILRESAKFTKIHAKHAIIAPGIVSNVVRQRSFSPSPSTTEHFPNSTSEYEGEQNLNVTNLNYQRSGDEIPPLANNLGLEDNLELELDNEESPTPTLGKRPAGRKASKEKLRGRKQKSNEISVGERLVKSIDDLHQSTSAEWQRANQLNEEEKQFGIKYRKLQIIRERITIERELYQFEKILSEDALTVVGSPVEKEKLLAAKKRITEELRTEANGKVIASMPFQSLIGLH